MEASGELFNSKESFVMQKITPCLWFDTQAEEAAKFYVCPFSRIPSWVPSRAMATRGLRHPECRRVQ